MSGYQMEVGFRIMLQRATALSYDPMSGGYNTNDFGTDLVRVLSNIGRDLEGSSEGTFSQLNNSLIQTAQYLSTTNGSSIQDFGQQMGNLASAFETFGYYYSSIGESVLADQCFSSAQAYQDFGQNSSASGAGLSSGDIAGFMGGSMRTMLNGVVQYSKAVLPPGDPAIDLARNTAMSFSLLNAALSGYMTYVSTPGDDPLVKADAAIISSTTAILTGLLCVAVAPAGALGVVVVAGISVASALWGKDIFRNARDWYVNQLMKGWNRAGGSTPVPRRDPLALDLDGNGIQTTSLDGGAFFDHDGDGFAEQTSWVAPGDGLLALDRNSDGIINNGGELFGDRAVLRNGTRASNGFQALAELDDNQDGRIDSSDAAYYLSFGSVGKR